MSGEFEAIGEMTQGGLTAAALEQPGAPRASTTHDDHAGGHADENGQCLNCGADVDSNYCGQCGQKRDIHHNVSAFLHDLAHGVLHFEGKIWNTLPLLVLHPGRLTRRYIDGERVRFFSPLALFLFTLFVTFGIFHALNSGIDPKAIAPQQIGQVQTARQSIERQIDAAQDRRTAAIEAGRPTTEADDDLRALQATLALMPKPGNQPMSGVRSDIPAIQAVIDKLRENPALLLYKLQGSAYKYAWAIIPFSAAFLWLLYPFSKRFGLYDHLIFVTYSLSFMLLLAAMMQIGASAGLSDNVIAPAALVLPPVHLYRQVRGTYGSSRLGSAARTILICLFGLIMLFAFTLALLAMGTME